MKPALSPSLEHEYAPKQILPIAMPADVLGPTPAHVGGIEEPSFAQAPFRQQVLGPIPQWSSQPLGKRNPEAHLRALYQFRRDVAVENLPQQPFALAIT